MSASFELISPETDGLPLLYLHGLGSPDPISSEMKAPLEALGFSVWALGRDDQAILNGENPEKTLTQGVVDTINYIKEETRQKIILIGNSLGSYLAITAAAQTNKNLHAVLGTDAFLEPTHGFELMERMSVDNRSTPKNQFAVPLTNNQWINLPKEIGQKFPDITPRLSKKIKVPVHLIWGHNDPFIKTSPTDLVPDANGLEIHQANHNEWMLNARAVASAQAFIEDPLL